MVLKGSLYRCWGFFGHFVFFFFPQNIVFGCSVVCFDSVCILCSGQAGSVPLKDSPMYCDRYAFHEQECVLVS